MTVESFFLKYFPSRDKIFCDDGGGQAGGGSYKSLESGINQWVYQVYQVHVSVSDLPVWNNVDVIMITTYFLSANNKHIT